MKNQIISELESLPDLDAYSLLDYLHFLKQKKKNHQPNDNTIKAIEEVQNDTGTLKFYSSVSALFDDLEIKL